MWALKLLAVFAGLYLILVLLIFIVQSRILFPAGMVAPAGPLPRSAQRLALETPGGETLHGVRIPGEGPLILGFGGNAWNAEAAADYLHHVFPGAEIVAFHYRGYRPSTGAPSAAALIEDAPFLYDKVAAGRRERPVVAVGFSIGSGVAAHLAAERELDGLVLVTPFDSLVEVAARHYRWLSVRLLFRHGIEPAGALAGRRVPTAILAGANDTLIPPARTEALRRAIPNLVYDRTIAGAGHNDIYERSDFQLAMREALRAILAAR